MDYSITFARHFARLVWLLVHQSGNVEEQKAALRAVVTVSKDGPVNFALQEWRLIVNGTPVPEVLTGVQDLAAQMTGHAVAELVVSQNALPGDLLGVARALAGEPVPGDGGRAVMAKLTSLDVRTVRLVAQAPAVPPTPAVDPAATTRPPRKSGGTTVGRTSGPKARPTDIVRDESSGSYLAFAAVQAPKGSVSDVLSQLEQTKSVNVMTRLLDDLVTLVDVASREGKTELVADTIYAAVVGEEARTDAGQKRAYTMALRRLNKTVLLRMVASLLPRLREKHDHYIAVLGRMGEDGADALIEQLTAAQSLSDRRMYFDALVKLKAGVPALIHMLGDARWYVARNAADLLGEMQTPEADLPLAELLRHDDERVRRAAASALAKVGTNKAFAALRGALRDSSPQVRLLAAAGLAARKGTKSAHTLTRALDEEEDGEVQMQIVATLGRLATADAVQRLIKLAEPAGGLFKKKSAGLRVAAVQALGEARTNPAIKALQELREDKDPEVREAAFRAVALAGRGSSASA